MTAMDDETLRMYVEESREHLSDIESDLLVIEEKGADIDLDLVNKVFRAAHSIKGGAGFLGMVKVKELAHKIENVLDLIRSQKLSPNPEVVNILLIAFDRLRELVNNIGESNEADITEFVVSLTGLSSSYLPKEEKHTLIKPVDICLPGGKAIMQIPEFDLAHAKKGGNYIYLVEYDLIHDVQETGKTPLGILKAMTGTGTIIDCVVEFSAVGDLDDAPANQLPFYILFATIADPEVITALFEVDKSRIHLISGEETNPAPVSKPEEVPQKAVQEIQKPVAPQPAAAEIKGADRKTASPHEKMPQAAPSGKNETSLRVNVQLLETLMNLAGELVLSRNQLLQSISINDASSIQASGHRINLVTSELQEAIMLTRMQPVGNVFNKFPRVVRDLSKDLSKDVRLNITGNEVEMDKTIIEGLSDPLTHLIRNAVDHGIEPPETRVKSGKNPTGTVHLKAYHAAGQVIVEISDDGKGIDPEKIASVAADKGLISRDRVKLMSEKEKMSLILLPGFSTAEKVSEVSGRGVGMDVVKTNLDRLGGKVEIESAPGKGSTFRIKLPLTLAIIPCLFISIDNRRFAIPQINVEELTRIPAAKVKEKIELVGDAEVLILRGKLIPIIQLSDVLDIRKIFSEPAGHHPAAPRRHMLADRRSRKSPLFKTDGQQAGDEFIPKGEDGVERRVRPDRRLSASGDLNVVVVTTGAFEYALVVDELHDSIEIVVKPLGRHLKHLKEYAGATIMGDGTVAPILDLAGLAAVAGLSSLSGSARAEELDQEMQREKYQDVQSLLLFGNGPGEHCAVPLNLVERVEQIRAEEIEVIGNKKVIKYRGESMPVFMLNEVADVKPLPDMQDLIVIVFRISGKEFGLLASQPVDTVEGSFVIDKATLKQKGVMGSSIIAGITTMFVDIFEVIETLRPEWYDGGANEVPQEPSDKTILLAEDSDFFRSQVKKFIEDTGYKVIAAKDGLEAWNILQEHAKEIELVVTDIEMPNLDGFGLTKNIKSDEKYSHLPVIAVTSLASEDDMARGKAAGIDNYQVKLDKEKLLTSINQYLNKT